MLLLGAALVAADPDDWHEYKPPDGDFVVWFPGLPAPGTLTKDGPTLTTLEYEQDGFMFTVMFMDLPKPLKSKEAEQSYLTGVRKGFVAATEKTKWPSEQREITVNGAPGFEMVIRGADGRVMVSRVVVSNVRQYHLVLGGQNQEAIQSPIAKRFLASFNLPKYIPPTSGPNYEPLGRLIGQLIVTLVMVVGVYVVLKAIRRPIPGSQTTQNDSPTSD